MEKGLPKTTFEILKRAARQPHASIDFIAYTHKYSCMSKATYCTLRASTFQQLGRFGSLRSVRVQLGASSPALDLSNRNVWAPLGVQPMDWAAGV